MLTDAQARKIACEWHGGGGSALYALCSSGAIDYTPVLHDIHAEIRECLQAATPEQSPSDLEALAAYCTEYGPSDPVEGWASLWPGENTTR